MRKRIFDIAISAAMIIPAAIICILFMPFIYADTRASPLFLQQRVGKNGKPFTIVKLRTMTSNTPDAGSHLVGSDSITRTGRLLRKAKIDELPQLLNVLAGQMSFVGPRPCLPNQVELIEARSKNGVLTLCPGITGPSQVAGIDMSQPQRLAISDASYLGPWSLKRDISLLIRTATGAGQGDAAISGSV